MTRPIQEPTTLREVGSLGFRNDQITFRDLSGVWVYVGTYPGDPDTIALSPPFENSWDNVGDPYQRMSFCVDGTGAVHIRGKVTGGADGTVVFTLPDLYRPPKNERFTGATDDPLSICTWEIASNGEVTFVGSS